MTGSWPTQGTLDLELLPAPGALLAEPLLATFVPVGARVQWLAVGQALSLTLQHVDVAPVFGCAETTMRVERLPDASSETPAGPAPATVYALQVTKKSASYTGTLVLDNQGLPLTLEVEEQTGLRRYQRLKPEREPLEGAPFEHSALADEAYDLLVEH